MSNSDILFKAIASKAGFLGEITLNRPAALNALTQSMCQELYEQLMAWANDPSIVAVMIRGNGDRAFCAGGDVRQIYQNGKTGRDLSIKFFCSEYRMDTAIHHFPKPFIAYLHNITMGGGAGVSIHGRYRLALENLKFAMPETRIGFFPDIGANYFLNQCPGFTGLYLALTGDTIDVIAAYELKIVTHIIPLTQMSFLESAILELNDFTGLDNLLDQYAVQPDPSALSQHYEDIDRCFNADSVEAIIENLENGSSWCQSTAGALKKRSPTSLKITFKAYHRSQSLSFDDIMQMDFNIAQECLNQADFFEGIRAALIDKDQAPQWQPPTLKAVSDEKIEAYFKTKKLLLTALNN